MNKKRPYYVLRRDNEFLGKNCYWYEGLKEETIHNILFFNSKKTSIMLQKELPYDFKKGVRIYNLTQEESQFLSLCKLKGISIGIYL